MFPTYITIIKDATISVVDSTLVAHQELSASTAFHKRSTYRKISNFSKLDKAKDFINLVIREVKSNKLSSIDETLNSLILHHPAKIANMTTVCTKTMYNYVHQGKIHLKPIVLPRMLRRKPQRNYKDYLPKHQKSIPISERTFKMDDRSNLDIGKGIWQAVLVMDNMAPISH